MNLKNLLVTGKTFGALRETRSPFELRRGGSLPTFESRPRFRQTPSPSPVGESGLPDGPNELWGNSHGSKRFDPEQTVPAKNASIQIKNVTQISEGVEAAKVKTEPSWLRNLFGRILPRRRRNSRDLVQGELALANIKVVRNDLNDSDLELVMAGERVVKKKNPGLITGPVEFFRVLQRQV
jgi:hypothetical protein